jgi:hypothetical protein
VTTDTYVNYYHDDPIHDSLHKDTPNYRTVERKASSAATVILVARLDTRMIEDSWREAA